MLCPEWGTPSGHGPMHFCTCQQIYQIEKITIYLSISYGHPKLFYVILIFMTSLIVANSAFNTSDFSH